MKRALFPWGLLALGVLLLVRLVLVETDQGRRLLLLLPWSRGEVAFVNSVTGRPVRLSFYPLWDFRGFRALTDPETEAYYTGGEYPWNEALARERRRDLLYCSEVGLSLALGPWRFRAEGGCLRVRLLFPP
ncbi:hypothetical protein AV541_04135 [Thermus parvatiensis]|mgnify:FL=1|uniref:Uncharacterized protein n=1 Tax=Thermus parvatiensis TaxID=456163 RepID=H7GGY9_9DEIN|nr:MULTISPECIES: hypothetical protein [Thermus]AMA75409.1 hypothetical protein AV541_04135 [Thermus parvatiensis]EIA38990.1 hypothetical protein RLTM_07498 [Thermus parvatiensis]